ncbi:hypothetical protein ACHAWF_017767 [Thalassiosira exigua]
MLAAEESRRLEENLMQLEMRRMIMNGGGGGGGEGTGAGRGSGMGQPVGQQEMQQGQQQQGQRGMRQGNNSNMNSDDFNLLSKAQRNNANDMSLMARAQRLQEGMPQQQAMGGGMGMGVGGMGMNMGMNQGGMVNWSNMATWMGGQNVGGFLGNKNDGDGNRGGGKAAKSKHSPAAVDISPIPIPRKVEPPRRPLSAYNIFFSEMREIILKEEAEGEEGDSPKKGGEGKEGDAKESPKGDDGKPIKAEEAGEATEEGKDMEAFTQKLMKKRLDKSKPKRAHRKSHGKVAFTSLAKTVGQRWRELPDKEKAKYKDLAEIDRARYRKDKAAEGRALREEVKRLKREARKEAKLAKLAGGENP